MFSQQQRWNDNATKTDGANLGLAPKCDIKHVDDLKASAYTGPNWLELCPGPPGPTVGWEWANPLGAVILPRSTPINLGAMTLEIFLSEITPEDWTKVA